MVDFKSRSAVWVGRIRLTHKLVCISRQCSMSRLQIKFLNLEPWDLPSSSSFSKLVLSMERVPPRSTTASSSVLWDTQEKRVTSEHAASSGFIIMMTITIIINITITAWAAPTQLHLAGTMSTVCVCVHLLSARFQPVFLGGLFPSHTFDVESDGNGFHGEEKVSPPPPPPPPPAAPLPSQPHPHPSLQHAINGSDLEEYAAVPHA